MADGEGAAFEAYARTGQRRLYRTAYLLCGDVEGARDLTQTTLAKLFQHWHRASRADNLDAYAKTVLVRTFVAERRRTVRDLLAHNRNAPRPHPNPAPGADLRVTLLSLSCSGTPCTGPHARCPSSPTWSPARYGRATGGGPGPGRSRSRAPSSRSPP
ncbi:sigma factor [Streptomyces sp. NPDC048142]|uniref:sigma factor n=1 Tax=Streptomyces sp. NPDC048142 TaxID=3365501 RepID=UPI00371F9BBB